MWLPSDKTRTPTEEELELLKENGWGWHSTGDDPSDNGLKRPCWHHADFDIGNEPFTTDSALEEIGRKTNPE